MAGVKTMAGKVLDESACVNWDADKRRKRFFHAM